MDGVSWQRGRRALRYRTAIRHDSWQRRHLWTRQAGSDCNCRRWQWTDLHSLTGHYDDSTKVHVVTEQRSDAGSENNTINVHSTDSASGAAAATQHWTDRITNNVAQPGSPSTDNGSNSNVTQRVRSTETSAVDTLMHDTADEMDTDIEFMRLAGINAQTRGDELEPQNQQRLKFRLAQETDTSLRHWFGLAKSGSQVYVIRDGLLWKRKPVTVDSDNEFLLCIPESYRNDILRMAHDSLHSGCHTSHKRTLSKIRQTFTWPNDRTAVRKYCKSCEICACKSARNPKDREFAQCWVVDVLGPSLRPTVRRKNKYVLVCIDFATRFTQLFAMRNLKSETLAEVFTNQLFARFGQPEKLIYDEQSGLTSHSFQNVLSLLKTESKIALTGFHTRTGLAERQIRSVSDTLKAYIHDPQFEKTWDTALNFIAFNLNQVPCRTLGFSSHELIFGKNLQSELDTYKDVCVRVWEWFWVSECVVS